MPASMLGAIDRCRPDSARVGRKVAEVRPVLAAHRLEPRQLEQAARHDRRRADRARNIPRRRRSPAPPTACRACRRRPSRRPSARAISRRGNGSRGVLAEAPHGFRDHLRAGQHVAGDREILAHPVAAPRRRTPRRCGRRTGRRRPARGAGGARGRHRRAVRMRTTSAAPTPSRISLRPCGAVERIDQRLRGRPRLSAARCRAPARRRRRTWSRPRWRCGRCRARER